MSYLYTRRYTGPLQAVILDWAGTTVDFGCLAPTAAFQAAFEGAGVPITLAQARAPMGLPKWQHLKAILADPLVAAAWVARHRTPASDDDIDALYERFLPFQVAVVAEHSELIPGVLETVAGLRARGLKIGSTTGYPRRVMDVVLQAAAEQGYAPDHTVCAGETPSGRPGPSMALKCVIELDVSPVSACVKIGDTVVDVEEGLNAGMWTIAVSESGNEVGLSQAEWLALSPAEQAQRAAAAAQTLGRAGAHYVVPRLSAVLPVLDEIEARLRRGEQP